MINLGIRTVFFILLVVAVFLAGVLFADSSFFNFLRGTPNVNQQVTTILNSVQLMSQLTTVRYNYDNILESEVDMPALLRGLYGQRLVLFTVGHVNAGVDLSLMTADNFQVTDQVLTIRLPAAQLQDCFFNEQDSHVISRDTGLFAGSLPRLDLASRRLALQEFRNSALESDILPNAQLQAENAIRLFIEALAGDQYRQIIVTSDPLPVQPVLPPTCQ